jgi:hypothetical protein
MGSSPSSNKVAPAFPVAASRQACSVLFMHWAGGCLAPRGGLLNLSKKAFQPTDLSTFIVLVEAWADICPPYEAGSAASRRAAGSLIEFIDAAIANVWALDARVHEAMRDAGHRKYFELVSSVLRFSANYCTSYNFSSVELRACAADISSRSAELAPRIRPDRVLAVVLAGLQRAFASFEARAFERRLEGDGGDWAARDGSATLAWTAALARAAAFFDSAHTPLRKEAIAQTDKTRTPLSSSAVTRSFAVSSANKVK